MRISTVATDPETAGRREAILEGQQVVLVDRVGLVVAFGARRGLGDVALHVGDDGALDPPLERGVRLDPVAALREAEQQQRRQSGGDAHLELGVPRLDELGQLGAQAAPYVVEGGK